VRIKFIEPEFLRNGVYYATTWFFSTSQGCFIPDLNEIRVVKQKKSLWTLSILIHELIHFCIYKLFGMRSNLHNKLETVDDKIGILLRWRASNKEV